MQNLSASRKMLNFACLLLMITFILEKIYSVFLFNEYIKNLFTPFLIIIINGQPGLYGENANTTNGVFLGRTYINENNSVNERALDEETNSLAQHEETNSFEQDNDEGEPKKIKDLNKTFKKKND